MEKTEPGKSTLIEAIAIALGLNPEGGSNNMQFSNYIVNKFYNNIFN